MRIPDRLRHDQPCFSFEFFPPKTAHGLAELRETSKTLAAQQPDFVSVTYGAAGSTRDGTVETCESMVGLGIETMAHLSCVGETIEGLESLLSRFDDIGIENVLALRGDPPLGQTDFVPPEGGLTSSPELAAFIRERKDWGIGGSAFPEVHPEADSPEADIEFLAEKVAAGAEFLVTQLFFDNEVFFDWIDRVRAAGITVPVIAGLMPIISYARTKRLCEVCDARFPEELERQLARLGGDAQAEREFGVEFAIEQGRELLECGVAGLHIYTLNRSAAGGRVLEELRG